MNKKQLTKIAKGAGIAGGGAILTYLLGQLPTIDFGSYTPLATAFFSVLINAGLKIIETKE
jgi:hypothetical protein